MKIKSTMALLLAMLILMTGILPGCGGDKKETTSDASTPSTAQTSTQTQPTPPEKKEIEISIAFWDLQEFGNDEIGKKICDDLKIKIKPNTLSWDNDLEQIKLFGATGMMPDVIASYTADYDVTRFYNWIDQGLLRDIPDEIASKYPTVKQIMDASPVLGAIKQLKGGKNWFIPRPGSVKNYYIALHQVFFYRKDWMANVGITKAPETMDEFYQMLKAFTNNDPNKNGKPDTYGLTSAKLNSAPFALWGIDPGYWVQEDGQWIPGYFSKKNIEPLKYFRKLYKDGVYDPEFSQNGWKQAIQKFTTNAFGVLLRNGDLHWLNKTIFGNWGVANPDVTDPLTVIDVLGPMKKDAASSPAWPTLIDAGGSEISSKVDDEKLDRILELFEYLLKPEVRKTIEFGIEGVDYTMDGEKVKKAIDPATNADVNINSKYPSTLIGCLTDWWWDNDIESINTTYPQGIKDMAKRVRDAFNPIAVQPNIAVGYISTPAKDTTSITWTDGFTQIVMGDDDVETMFNKFVEDSKNLGMGTAIQEVNVKTSELGIK